MDIDLLFIAAEMNRPEEVKMTLHLHRYMFSLILVLLFLSGMNVRFSGATCIIDENGTYIEAENFSGSYDMPGSPGRSQDRFSIASDANANGGTVLVAGSAGTWGSAPTQEVKEYTVSFQSSGVYQVWVRGRGFGNNANSAYFSIDGNNWSIIDFTNGYRWKKFRGGGNSFSVASGSYTLRIGMRERLSRIDGFYIVKAGGNPPTDATVPSTVSTINPQIGCSGPYWSFSANSLGPTCFVGYNAASMALTLTNIGDDDGTPALVTSNASWAVVNNPNVPPLLKNGTYVINVSFQTSALAKSTYQAELTITGSANNSPRKIPITLLVKDTPSTAACGEIPLYAENLVNPAIMVQLDTSGSMRTHMMIAKNDAQDTPDLKAIVQEIVDRTGWVQNNAMAFVIDGNGTRRAWSFDGDDSDAPVFTVTYADSLGNPVTVSRKISSSEDDAQIEAGVLNTGDASLQLGRNAEPVGLRFTNIGIPQGATIVDAKLSFSVYQGDSGSCNLVIKGVAEDNVSSLGSLATATLTSAATSWSPASWLESMRRIDIAEDVLKEVFLDRSIAWGFATWAGGSCRSTDGDNPPTYYTNYRIGSHTHDAAHQAALQDKADDGSPGGCTPLAPTMRGGLQYFEGNRTDSFYHETYSTLSCQPRILVLITDGIGNTGTTNAKIDTIVNDLINHNISVVVVGFGLTNATQLQRIVNIMQPAGNASDDDYLYALHNNDSSGNPVPFMAQNRKEFIDAMNSIVSNVKAQLFHGASPAPTTSVDNGEILLNASFDASDWTGNITATKFDAYTGDLEATHTWKAKDMMPASTSINGFIFDSLASSKVSKYTDLSISGDNYLCKSLGDIINSTPKIVGQPPYYYKFDSYFSFKYNQLVSNRDQIAYVGANDGALHAFNIKDGIEQWRFYPDSVKSTLALAATSPQDDMCSPSYCHKFILDGTPQPADIYTGTEWRTILTTGLGEGGSAYFALDVTYGKDFDEPPVTVSGFPQPVDVASQYLWEFSSADDTELGFATSLPSTARVADVTNGGTVWATYFGSGSAVTPSLQANKEAYIFAVNSYDKSKVWKDGGSNPVYSVKLSSTTLKNDYPNPLLVADTQGDDYIADRIYVGNLYGDLYRFENIGFGETPVAHMLFNGESSDHSIPVTAKAGLGFAGGGNVWVYFGTGKYIDQVDKLTGDQQYFYGLFDAGASTSTTYKRSDLVEIETGIVEAYALDETGAKVDLNEDGTVDSNDLKQYRTVFCSSPDPNGNCNPNAASWLLKLIRPSGSGSERVISQPLIVGGIVFFTTFVPDDDPCQGNGKTWLFAVDWRTGEFVSDAVFDINNNNHFDPADQTVEEAGTGVVTGVAGIFIGTGKPAPEIAMHNDILFVGTTDQPPNPIKVNIPVKNVRLRSWEQLFN